MGIQSHDQNMQRRINSLVKLSTIYDSKNIKLSDMQIRAIFSPRYFCSKISEKSSQKDRFQKRKDKNYYLIYQNKINLFFFHLIFKEI